MRINDTELEYFIDYINKIIHLMDLDNSGTRSLTNAIDPTFQKMFIEQESLLKDVYDFKWICYGTDGIITEYRTYNFNFISSHYNELLHEPYVSKMKERTQRRYGRG